MLKRIYFLKNSILQEEIEDIPTMSNPVPITPEEQEKLNSISNMTKAQIEKKILSQLDMIMEPEILDYHMLQFRQRVKGRKKADYISYHTELSLLINAASMTDVFDDTMSESA